MSQTFIALFEQAPFFISFIAGVVTFLSPCVLPLVPAYLSYITGISAKELHTTHPNSYKTFWASVAFVFGFALVFVTLGTIMAGLVSNIFAHPWVPYAAGCILVAFGLHFIGVFKIKWLYYEKRFQTQNARSNYLWAFVLGVAFALGWTPCIGPIFASIIALGANYPSKSLTLMILYTLGLGLPFLITGLLTQKALGFFETIKPHLHKIEIASGVMMIVIGGLMISGDLSKLSLWLIKYLPLL